MNRRKFLSGAAVLACTWPLSGIQAAELKKIKPTTAFQGHRGVIQQIVFAVDETYVYSMNESTITKWEWPSGKRVINYPGGDNTRIIIDSENARILRTTQSPVSFIDLKDAKIYKMQWRNPEGNPWLQGSRAAEIHRDLGIYSFVQGGDGIVYIGMSDLKTVGFRKIPKIPNEAKISRNLSKIIWLDISGAIINWDLRKNKKLPELFGHRGGTDSLHISADGKRAVSSGSGELAVWNLLDSSEISRVRLSERTYNRWGDPGAFVKVHAMSSNFTKALIGSDTLYIYDLEKDELEYELPGIEDYVNAAAFSASSKSIVAGDGRGNMAGWSLA